MQARFAYIFLGILIFLCCPPKGFSQEVTIEPLSETEGLSHNGQWSTNALMQDDLGQIWIATLDGLNRYDGYDIRQFDLESINGMSFRRKIIALAQDVRQRIWIGTHGDGLYIFDPVSEQVHSFESEYEITDKLELGIVYGLHVDREGKLYIAFPHVLFELNPHNDKLSVVFELPDNHLAQAQFIDLSDDRLCMVSQGAVLVRNPQEGWSQIAYDDIALHADLWQDGRIKIGNSDGSVFALDVVTGLREQLQAQGFTPDQLREFHNVAGSWFSQKHQLLWQHTQDQRSFTQPFPKGEMLLCDMLAVNSQEVYFMSHHYGAGKISIDKHPFHHVTDELILTICKHNGEIYFGGDQGIFQMTPDSLKRIYDLPRVRTMAFSDRDHLLVTQHIGNWGRTSEFDQKGNLVRPAIQTYIYGQIMPLQDGVMAADHHSNLPNGPDLTFIADYFTDVIANDFTDVYVQYFRQGAKGDLWVITVQDGLVHVSADGNQVTYPEFDQKGNRLVKSYGPHYIFEDSRSVIYLASSNGLYTMNPDSKAWSAFVFPGPEESVNIRAMGEDSDGVVWMMGRKILYRYDPVSSETSYFKVPEAYRIGTHDPDDLISDQAGYFYYWGLVTGVERFHPKQIINQRAPHDITFSALYIDRERCRAQDHFRVLDSSITYQSNFDLTWSCRNVGFEYVSMFGDDVDANYYYRLNGFDGSWRNAGQDRMIHFTNLDPGEYTFEVKAKASGGRWTENTAMLQFSVIAPWYRTYEAYLGYFLLTMLMAYAFYRYRVAEILRYQDLRTQISSDLHDDVGTILSSVAMQSEVLSLDAPPEQIDRFDKLSRMSREAMGRMRDTVWAIDARKDNMESLVDRMQDYLADLVDPQPKWTYRFDQRISGFRKIAPDIRQNVYLIFKEAVNNAMKHSNGTELLITLDQEPRQLTLLVHDNGQVDPATVKTSGSGLTNLRMRAMRIGGELMINWNDGVEVSLVVPS